MFALADQMLEPDLALGGDLGDLVDGLDDPRIVHVAIALDHCGGDGEAELALQPVGFQAHVIAQETEQLAARRPVVRKCADLRIDRPRHRTLSQPLHLREDEHLGIVHHRHQCMQRELRKARETEILIVEARPKGAGSDRDHGQVLRSRCPAQVERFERDHLQQCERRIVVRGHAAIDE